MRRFLSGRPKPLSLTSQLAAFNPGLFRSPQSELDSNVRSVQRGNHPPSIPALTTPPVDFSRMRNHCIGDQRRRISLRSFSIRTRICRLDSVMNTKKPLAADRALAAALIDELETAFAVRFAINAGSRDPRFPRQVMIETHAPRASNAEIKAVNQKIDDLIRRCDQWPANWTQLFPITRLALLYEIADIEPPRVRVHS